MNLNLNDDGFVLIRENDTAYIFVSWRFLFHEGDNVESIAFISGEDINFLDTPNGRKAVELWDSLVSRPCKRVQLERLYEFDSIIADLDRLDVPYELERKCLFGNIDVFIKTSPPMIIETKRDSDTHNIKKAIGQLALYSYEYPDAKLYIAIYNGLDPKYLPVLEKWGIKEWTPDVLTKSL